VVAPATFFSRILRPFPSYEIFSFFLFYILFPFAILSVASVLGTGPATI